MTNVALLWSRRKPQFNPPLTLRQPAQLRRRTDVVTMSTKRIIFVVVTVCELYPFRGIATFAFSGFPNGIWDRDG